MSNKFSIIPRKKLKLLFFLHLVLFSCKPEGEIGSIDPKNWTNRMATIKPMESLETGSTYLYVYPEIYSYTALHKHNLTESISMRNTDRVDKINLLKTNYFNTHGHLIRNYFNQANYLLPLETFEIVIDETNESVRTGANFVIDWTVNKGNAPPYFEGVMISTTGQQDLSFIT